MTKRRLIAACISTLATAPQALAEVPGIQNHKVQKLFMEAPCADVIATIDQTKTPIPENPLIPLGEMAMAFGFLMGFEATHPGIRGTHETALMRLREDCKTAGDPKLTAFEILKGYTGE